MSITKISVNLTKPTHNLMSNIMIAQSGGVVPEVGMGATFCWYTDRHAATVIETFEIKGVPFIKVQQDKATRTDNYGMSDCQDYEYSRDENGRINTYRMNKNGSWEGVIFNEETKRWKKYDRPALLLGVRREYYDYSF